MKKTLELKFCEPGGSPLLVTYEVRKFLAILIAVVLKIQMVFGSYLKRNILTLEIKRKHLKDILR
jgi:integral membrane sensor domain MASE1